MLKIWLHIYKKNKYFEKAIDWYVLPQSQHTLTMIDQYSYVRLV